MHRIREAMALHPSLFERFSGTVEIDETYVGGKDKNKHRHLRKNRPGKDGKEAVVLTGRARRHGPLASCARCFCQDAAPDPRRPNPERDGDHVR